MEQGMCSDDWRILRQLVAVVDARQVPATRVEIVAHLARLANHFRAERPADSWEMLFDDYAHDLEGISLGHLKDAIEAQRREKPWFPKVSEILERWNKLKYAEAERGHRARVLLKLEPPRRFQREPQPSEPILGDVLRSSGVTTLADHIPERKAGAAE